MDVRHPPPPAGLTRPQWASVQRLLVRTKATEPSGRVRLADRVLAALGLAAVAPVLAVAGLLVRRESRGPLAFRQVRIGTHGRRFEIFKLRTMKPDATGLQDEVAAADNVHASLGDERMFKAYADPRVTRAGALLRALGIDELPQLVNVVRGEMALVGPRPLTLDEDRWVDDQALVRRRVPPGITGLWQVAGGNAIGFGGMTHLDALYVRFRSVSLDARLLAATPRSVLRDIRAWRRGSTG